MTFEISNHKGHRKATHGLSQSQRWKLNEHGKERSMGYTQLLSTGLNSNPWTVCWELHYNGRKTPHLMLPMSYRITNTVMTFHEKPHPLRQLLLPFQALKCKPYNGIDYLKVKGLTLALWGGVCVAAVDETS